VNGPATAAVCPVAVSLDDLRELGLSGKPYRRPPAPQPQFFPVPHYTRVRILGNGLDWWCVQIAEGPSKGRTGFVRAEWIPRRAPLAVEEIYHSRDPIALRRESRESVK
jgi:hypothetical protein